MQDAEHIGASHHYHADHITPAAFDFLLMGGAVHWLAATVTYDPERQSFNMVSESGGRHQLHMPATDSERLNAHWQGFLKRCLVVMDEMKGT